jgi:maltooligosyltrehalose trehalohydrolase
MAAVGDGWYEPSHPLSPGQRYGYSLDGGPVRADPRSHWQPDGLSGLSVVVDHDRFAWTDGQWRGLPLAGSVIYELHVGTFTPEGTFDAAVSRLDHLSHLGVTTIELMPVAQLPGRWSWGYDGVLLYAADDGYGGPEGLKRFVDAAHRHGLAVLLDVVYNHFGPEHCYLGEFGPYTHEAGTTPWGQAVNLDGEGSDGVREHLLGNAAHWLDRYHLDGLRLDATHALVDRSSDPFLAQLAELAASLSAAARRTITLIAEDERDDPALSRSRDAVGIGLDGQWSDDQHHALHALLTGERAGYYAPWGRPDQLVKALNDVFVTLDDAAPAVPAGAAPRHRFVVCSQNHDQVGNRAAGERLCHLVGPEAARAAAAITLLGPCTPLLFQGEEWAATSPFPFFATFEDPELRRRVREGRQQEFAAFGWDAGDIPDPVDPATRDSAVLRWDERDEPAHAAMLDWYDELLRLRREWPELADPDPEATCAALDPAGRVLVLRRGSVLVLVNLTAEPAALTCDAGDELAVTPGAATGSAGSPATLPAFGVVVARAAL